MFELFSKTKDLESLSKIISKLIPNVNGLVINDDKYVEAILFGEQ